MKDKPKNKLKDKPKLTTRPSTSAGNKTGAWRTHKPVINQEKCIGCSLCAKICPEGCIAMVRRPENNRLKPVVNYEYCKGCALCAHECPVKAIAMEYEK